MTENEILSEALEANIANSRVNVSTDSKYEIFREVLGEYYGVREGLRTFLEELCHPYRNWAFIVREARGYALNYFHLIKSHEKGTAAAKLFEDIFLEAIHNSPEDEVRVSAADNLLLFIQKILKDSGDKINEFLPAIDYGFERIKLSDGDLFYLFPRS